MSAGLWMRLSRFPMVCKYVPEVTTGRAAADLPSGQG
jgi:hypothetical protein